MGPSEAKENNFRDIRSMISDYKKQRNRFPTVSELAKAIGMAKSAMNAYLRIIREEDRQALLEVFQGEMINDTIVLIKTINENIKVFIEIRDDDSINSGLRMDAAKNLQEACSDQLRIKRDGPEYLADKYKPINDTVESKEETKEVLDIAKP